MTEILKLTDGLPRSGSSYPSISKDGSLLYVVYSDTLAVAAEFFTNRHGKLIPLNTLIKDPNFPIVQDGYANRSFTRFTLVDASNTDGRIRLFSQQFNLIAERVFPGVFDILGGVFSPDEKYIALTFIFQANPQLSRLVVLDAKNLNIVATIDFATHTNGPEFIQHKGNTFIVISSGGSSNDPEQDFFGPPAQVSVYRLNHFQLTLLDSQPLPQFPLVTGVMHRCIKDSIALIGVGTRAAFLLNEKGLPVNTTEFQSFLPNDGDEVRFYSFDLLAVGYVNELLSDSGFLTVYQVCGNKIQPLQSNIPTLPAAFQAYFSENGRWFTIGGFNDPETAPAFNNVLLYKVNYCK